MTISNIRAGHTNRCPLSPAPLPARAGMNSYFWLEKSAGTPVKKPVVRKLRCAVYTRKSSEEGLDMEFNSLDAQREACEAFCSPFDYW